MSGGGTGLAITTLFELIPSLSKLAAEIVASANTAKSNAQLIEFQNALIGLNSMLASVQQENATLRAQKNDAEAELKRVKDWEAQKERYQLVTPYSGVFAYALKKSMSNGEAPHYLCANCFETTKRSFLAHTTATNGFVTVVCSACRFAAATRWRSLGAAKYAEDIPPQG